MKKVFPIVLLLVAVAAAVFFYLKRTGTHPDLPPGFAAELAPADAVVFVEAPDLKRSLERWKKNGLYLISQEPEWKEFTSKWDAFVAESDYAQTFFGALDPIIKADPASFFLAIGKGIEPFPKVVGGFPYRGKKSDVEGVIRKLKEQLLKSWPGAKSELSKYDDIEIETITSATPVTVPSPRAIVPSPAGTPPPTQIFPKVLLAYRDNWFFFATDQEILNGALDRYRKKAGAAPGLAGDALFQETLKHGNAEPDLTAWSRWSVFSEFSGFSSALMLPFGGPPPATPAVPDPNPIQSVLYSWKLDGPIMRDRFYVHMTQPPKLTALEHRSVGLTNAHTYAYLDINYDNLVERSKWLRELGAEQVKMANSGLKEHGLTVEDIFTTFGPELALSSAWPGIVSLDVVATLEVRDPVKARKFAELIALELGSGPEKPATVETKGATTIWTSPTGLGGQYRPTLAITDRHLFFSSGPIAVEEAIKQLSAKGPTLATKPGSPYAEAIKTVNAPHGALLYVDTKLLFERLYSYAKPQLAFQFVGNPAVGKYFDAGKLPRDTTISQHLAPMVMSYGTDGQGWLIESTGTFSLFVGVFGVVPPALFGVRSVSVPPAPIPGGASAPAIPAPVTPVPAGTPP